MATCVLCIELIIVMTSRWLRGACVGWWAGVFRRPDHKAVVIGKCDPVAMSTELTALVCRRVRFCVFVDRSKRRWGHSWSG